MQKPRLMIAGPVDVEDSVLAALGQPILPHYGSVWMPIFETTSVLLQRLYQTKGDVLMVPGPGSNALDTAIGSLVPEGASICIPSNGFFATKLQAIAKAYGIRVWNIDFPIGKPIEPKSIARALKKWIPMANVENQPILALAVVHHETSTGILNPLEAIARVAQEFDLPIIVDAIASLGGTRISNDEWGLDVCVGVPNKCLAAPAGIALMSVSPRAWELAENNSASHGWYSDLRTWAYCREDPDSPFPYPGTLPTSIIIALNKALDSIFEIGIDSHFANIADASQHVRTGMTSLGFKLFPSSRYAAPMLSVFSGWHGLDLDDMSSYLLEDHNVMIARGIGNMRGQVIRVGHMGRAEDRQYSEALLRGVRTYLQAIQS